MRDWSGLETAAAIRRREVSAQEVCDAAILRAKAARHLGAIVTETFEQARSRAQSELSGPFAGVPTFVKDLNPVAGVRTTWGSAASGFHISKRSDPVVLQLERLGLVSLGKSATPELGLTGTTEPLAFGPCRNPWSLGHTPGGSSGGGAALVAAGVVPVAHANDGGGSIRIPASCCGLVGLKPSRGVLDMGSSRLLPINLASEGIVARTIPDLHAFFQGLRSGSAEAGLDALTTPESALKIGVFIDTPWAVEAHPDVRRATLSAAETCEVLGHHVERIACPYPSHVMDDFFAYWRAIAYGQSRAGKWLLHRGWEASRVEPFTKALAAGFARNKVETLSRTIPRLRSFSRAYTTAFTRHDVILCPTLGTPPPPLGHLRTDESVEIAEARLRAFVAYTPLQNISGAPGLSIPWGRTEEGLPLGVHLAALPGQDHRLLQLGWALERAHPWPKLAELKAPDEDPT